MKLSTLLVDSKAIQEGQWVSPGEEFDDFEILTRGFTDAYTDAKAARTRKAASAYLGDERKIPNAVSREIIVDCLVAHVLLDVRGLVHDDNSPVTFDHFVALIRDPAGATFLNAAIRAAASAGIARKDALETATGN